MVHRLLSSLATLFLALAALPAVAQDAAPTQEPATPAAEVPVGAISGSVYDDATLIGLVGAQVTVVGTDVTTTSGNDGAFVLRRVPTGDRTIRVEMPGYEPVEVGGIAVIATLTSETTVEMRLLTGQGSGQAGAGDDVIRLEEFVVTTRVLQNTGRALMRERRLALAAQDSLSSTQLQRLPGADIGSIMKNIVGVSTVRSGGAPFVVIRGLSERYNPILLDNVPMPSADPERQNPQLDLFPTRLMSAVVVSKTFEPRLPGNSSGGAVDLRTHTIPDARVVSLTAGLRFDEGVFTGERFRTYATYGNRDEFALGATDRIDAPSGTQLNRFPGDVPLGAREKDLPVGARLAFTFQDAFQRENGAEIGVGFSFGYDSSYSTENIERYSLLLGNTTYVTRDIFSDNSISANGGGSVGREMNSNETINYGALTTLGYKFNEDHTLSSTVFLSQSGVDDAGYRFRSYTASNEDENLFAQSWQEFLTKTDRVAGLPLNEFFQAERETLHYKQRTLFSTRLGGEHQFDLGTWKLAWTGNYIWSTQEEPDFRFTPYLLSPSGLVINLANGDRPAVRFWRDTREESWYGIVEGTRTFDLGWMQGAKVIAGFGYDYTTRGFEGVTSLFNDTRVSSLSIPTLRDLAPLLSGLSGPSWTAGLRSFANGERRVFAPHLTLDLPVLRDLRIAGGVRFERTRITTVGSGVNGAGRTIVDAYNSNPWLGAPTYPPEVADQARQGLPFDYPTGLIDDERLLPAISVIYAINNAMNLRLGASETIARPSFRELGPYFTTDEVTAEEVVGNVALRLSKVQSVDLRWEWFPGSSNVFAATLFAKKIENPIERIAGDNLNSINEYAGTTFWNNPEDARIYGAEFEFRQNLSVIADVLQPFTISGNLTLIDALVKISEFERNRRLFIGYGTPDANGQRPGTPPESRRLFDQPRYLANIDLAFDMPDWGFSASVIANFSGNSLVTVNSITQTPDLYRDSTHTVDLTLSQSLGDGWSVRATARNLTDPTRYFVYDPEQLDTRFYTRAEREGRSYTVSVSKSF